MELAVAMVYGKALFDAALELDKVSEIKEEIKQINEIFKAEDDFYMLLTNPSISVLNKKDIIKNVFEGRVMTEVLSFMYILADKGRVIHFDKIVKEFEKLESEQSGVTDGIAYSATPLTKDQLKKLEQETGKLLNKNITLTNAIDKTLIGGVKIMAEGKLIDASIRSRLNRLSSQIKGN